MKKWTAVALVLAGATILGATVLQEPIASAAQLLNVTIVGPLDADGHLRVHEQGTAKVTVTNGPLSVIPVAATTPHVKMLTAAGGTSDAESLDPAINASLITITSMQGRGNLYVGDGSALLAFRLESGHDLVLPMTQPFAVTRLQVDCFPSEPPAGCQALINVVGTRAQ